MRIYQYYQFANRQLVSNLVENFEPDRSELFEFWRIYMSEIRGRKSLPDIDKRYRETFANLFIVFDLAIISLEQYRILLLMLVLDDAIEKKNTYRCSFTICCKVIADLKAVRLLTTNGLDVQARMIARTISEHIDALNLSCFDNNFCNDFVANQTAAESNKIWFKYISKGKARKRIFETKIPDEASKEMLQFLNEEDQLLSQAVHPSFIAGFMNFLPQFEEDENSPPKVDSSEISSSSLRTLRFATFRSTQFFALDLIKYNVLNTYIDIANKVSDFPENSKKVFPTLIKICLYINILVSQNSGPLYEQETPDA